MRKRVFYFVTTFTLFFLMHTNIFADQISETKTDRYSAKCRKVEKLIELEDIEKAIGPSDSVKAWKESGTTHEKFTWPDGFVVEYVGGNRIILPKCSFK